MSALPVALAKRPHIEAVGADYATAHPDHHAKNPHLKARAATLLATVNPAGADLDPDQQAWRDTLVAFTGTTTTTNNKDSNMPTLAPEAAKLIAAAGLTPAAQKTISDRLAALSATDQVEIASTLRAPGRAPASTSAVVAPAPTPKPNAVRESSVATAKAWAAAQRKAGR